MLDNVLSIKNLSKTYHDIKKEVLAINNISFDVANKEFISIVGPSGCGKSTILGIIADILDKSSGEIIFKNDNPVIGYMLQEDCLLNWKTVYENCLLGLEIRNELTDENKDYVLSLLKKYGLEDFINSYPDSLSGGMKQRVALIRTLAINPDILLLDEAFSNLDYQTRLTLSDDIYKIIKNEGKTAIMVTHDIAEAVSMSDRVIVLTKRPSKIKTIHEISLDDKSIPTKNRKDKMFDYYYEMIWKELDHNV